MSLLNKTNALMFLTPHGLGLWRGGAGPGVRWGRGLGEAGTGRGGDRLRRGQGLGEAGLGWESGGDRALARRGQAESEVRRARSRRGAGHSGCKATSHAAVLARFQTAERFCLPFPPQQWTGSSTTETSTHLLPECKLLWP